MKFSLKAILGVTTLAATLFACKNNSDYKKTKEGLAYKIHTSGKGEFVKPGQFIKVYFSNALNDSTLTDNFGKMPAYGPYDTAGLPTTYNFIDFLHEMRVGDSAEFSIPVDTLIKHQLVPANEVFKPGAVIKGKVKLAGVFATQEEVNKDQEGILKEIKEAEIAAIEKHLKEKNITNFKKTNEGVFVIVEKEGTGSTIDTGAIVTLNYTGTLLKNGEKFDSNVDSAFNHVQPFEYAAYQGNVIPGWDAGVGTLKEGSKAKIYVPSMLGYGPQERGPQMPAYSNLVFDVEVLKVTPKPAGLPSMMPPPPPPAPSH